MVPTQGNVIDFETNDFTKYYEDLTNIHIDWLVIPSGERETKVNLALASKDLPDIFTSCKISLSQQMVYGQSGAFLPLNDYIDKYSSILKEGFNKIVGLKEAITLPDGNIYALPYVDDNPHTSAQQKMWINKEWLEALNLKLPTTTEEFYEVLKAFKERDPNGNGKPDEIPLTACVSSSGLDNSSIIGFIMDSFVFNDLNNNQLYVDNGVIKASYVQDGYREGLRYLNRLYKEGLIAPTALTQSSDELKAQGENGGDVILGAFPGLVPTAVNIGQGGRWTKYVAVEPLTGPDGTKQTIVNPYAGMDFTRTVITTACKYPAAAFRWVAEQYDKDMNQRALFGVEGVNWRWAEKGEVSRDGQQADVVIFIDGVSWTDQQNYCWRSIGVRLEKSSFPENMYKQGLQGDINTNIEFLLYKETIEKYVPYGAPASMVLPPLVFDEVQSATIGDYQTVIKSYVNEMTVRFINGDISLDTGWDSYVKELYNKGLDKYLEVYQKAYDQKYKR